MKDDLMITVVGWVATNPKEVVGNGTPFTSFRLASTRRRYDAAAGRWVDGSTEWFTVKAFRDAAFNIAASVSKSQPVVVHGRLLTEEWVSEQSGPRTSLVIEATTVGHDLMRGTAKFARRVNAQPDGAAEPAAPALEDDPWAVDGAVESDGTEGPEVAQRQDDPALAAV